MTSQRVCPESTEVSRSLDLTPASCNVYVLPRVRVRVRVGVLPQARPKMFYIFTSNNDMKFLTSALAAVFLKVPQMYSNNHAKLAPVRRLNL